MKSCNGSPCIDCGGEGICSAEVSLGELRDMEAGRIPLRAVRVTGVQLAALTNQPLLTDNEIAELLPDEDPSLIGNRIAAVTTALGIPPCCGCGQRRDWLNRAHLWLREQFIAA